MLGLDGVCGSGIDPRSCEAQLRHIGECLRALRSFHGVQVNATGLSFCEITPIDSVDSTFPFPLLFPSSINQPCYPYSPQPLDASHLSSLLFSLSISSLFIHTNSNIHLSFINSYPRARLTRHSSIGQSISLSVYHIHTS